MNSLIIKNSLPLGKNLIECPFEIILTDTYDQIAVGDFFFQEISLKFDEIEYQFKIEKKFLCLKKVLPLNLQSAQRAVSKEIYLRINPELFLKETGLLLESKSSLDVRLSLRKCQIGEYFSIDRMECLPCDPNFFSFSENFLEPSSCHSCSRENFNCYGGFNLTPKAGFWRMGYKSRNFINCVVKAGK